MSLTADQRARASGMAMASQQNDDAWTVTVDGITVCHDCLHLAGSHSIPDPDGTLNYGGGECGDCTECGWETPQSKSDSDGC